MERVGRFRHVAAIGLRVAEFADYGEIRGASRRTLGRIIGTVSLLSVFGNTCITQAVNLLLKKGFVRSRALNRPADTVFDP